MISNELVEWLIEEKKMQRALIHFHKPENRKLAEKALVAAGRRDLIPVFFSQRRQGNDNTGNRNKPNNKNNYKKRR